MVYPAPEYEGEPITKPCLSDDHKDNRWSLLSADLREIEQAHNALLVQHTAQAKLTMELQQRIVGLEQAQKKFLTLTTLLTLRADLASQRLDHLENVCEQCILEHQGRSQ